MNIQSPIFKSRPDLSVPELNISFISSNVSPGYLFVAPYGTAHSGPLIYNHTGRLIWAGSEVYASPSGDGPHVFDFHKCNYRGSDHLCLFRGLMTTGAATGQGLILDMQYRIVKRINCAGVSQACDLHEFSLVDNGTSALVTQYRKSVYDLAQSGRSSNVGWLVDSYFQDIDVETGSLNFEWKASDHIDFADSTAQIDSSEASASWDFAHVNSVDKNRHGDYMVSSRHTSCIYKISGVNGSILWRLGGSKSSFQTPSGLSLFDSQHHARWQSENETHSRISLFNNGFAIAEDHRPSKGLIVELDHLKKVASIVREYYAPGNAMETRTGGSMMPLENENVLIGWGRVPCLTEYSRDGELLFHACITDVEDHNEASRLRLYRVYKTSWISSPSTIPALWTYARNSTSLTAFYMSWNGATEVQAWRIFTSASREGTYNHITTAEHADFETLVTNASHHRFSYVEAVSSDNRLLGRSDITETFRPPDSLSSSCGELWCPYEPSRMMSSAHVDETYQWNMYAGLAETSVVFVILAVLCGVFNSRRRRAPVGYVQPPA